MNAIREIADGMATNMAEIDRKMSARPTVRYVRDRNGFLIRESEQKALDAYEAVHGPSSRTRCGNDGRCRDEDLDHFIAFCKERGLDWGGCA